MEIRTQFSLDETVEAPQSLKQPHAQNFTVEAVKIDKSGVQYLVSSEPPEFPHHQVRGWVKEVELKRRAREPQGRG